MSSDESDRDEPRTVVELTQPRVVVPAQGRQTACLIVLSGAASAGKIFKVNGEMVIGRADEAEIRLDEPGVSRRHAKVVVNANGEVELIDLGSTNGTYHHGQRVRQIVLPDGDKVQVGSTAILKFSYQDALEEAMQKNLYEAATRDPVTHLYNKKFFLEALQKEVSYARRHQLPLTMLIVDADHFKRVNDTWGHPAGDHVLARLGEILKRSVRDEDVVARYGGEEFALILRETPAPMGLICAERIRVAIERSEFVYEGQKIPVTVSIGLATLEPQMQSPDDLFALADQRLYAAKSAGRNRVCVGA